MSVSALVDCVVLSLQDSVVFYPCCKGCCSRVQELHNDVKRCQCPKCGYICLREEVDYRYRLSLRVSRDRCIFGLTVFGTCLNRFFGINATGLHRLVENLERPIEASDRSALLVKAVQDCFIGRHFIFDIKVTKSDPEPWLQRPVAIGCSSKDSVQLIASQMILPKCLGLDGFTVVSFYRSLLKRAEKCEPSDRGKISSVQEAGPLLLPHRSPASSSNDDAPFASGLLCLPSQGSQHPDCTLTPTPPWQQSLGLITSSAEQEEDSSTLESEECSQQMDKNKTPHPTQRDCLDEHDVTMERVPSPLPLRISFYNNSSFATYSNLASDKDTLNSPFTNNWFSPCPYGQKSSRKKKDDIEPLKESILSDSLVWEDLLFSESLTKFLGEENKNETQQNQFMQNLNETASCNLDVGLQDSSVESKFVHGNGKQITNNNSWSFQSITDSTAASGADRLCSSDQESQNLAECVKIHAKNTFYHDCKHEDQKEFFTSFENVEEECDEGDTYDCSADLFSGSLMIDISTNALNMQQGTISEASPMLSEPKTQHMRTENFIIPLLTTHMQKKKGKRRSVSDLLLPQCAQQLEFAPSSQSTPVGKLPALTATLSSAYRTLAFSESPSKTDSFGEKLIKRTSSICKQNSTSENQLILCDSASTKENMVPRTPSSRYQHVSKRQIWKYQKRLLHQHHLSVQSVDNNTDSPGTINNQSHFTCDASMLDNEELRVPSSASTHTENVRWIAVAEVWNGFRK